MFKKAFSDSVDGAGRVAAFVCYILGGLVALTCGSALIFLIAVVDV